ncbi:MAG: putative molibdopterin-dependent oxidoreductase YjgC [Myxococcota bacterium]|jgi:predicted molibdopterin-dependent oxidoreductase YjgC
MSAETFTLTVDGEATTASVGETVLDVTRRLGRYVPTLCHDDRLDPAGACRACLVEVEGQRRLQAACAFKATAGQVVTTRSDRIDRHRQVLLSMYLADHTLDENGRPIETADGNELLRWQEALEADGHATLPLPAIHADRAGRDDPNPYIGFDPDSCILCARCVRYCDEVEAVSAITLSERGSRTTIATVDDISLLDSSCELCGGCIDTCPTGALFEKKAPRLKPGDTEKVRTTCNFCGVGCQLDLHVRDDRVVRVSSPPPGETVNDGNLCVKGRFATDFIHHGDRLTQPLIRRADGQLHPASWPEAIQYAADGLLGVRDKYGADSLAFISSSRCTGEENYLVQKLARAAFGTNNCHQCAAT